MFVLVDVRLAFSLLRLALCVQRFALTKPNDFF